MDKNELTILVNNNYSIYKIAKDLGKSPTTIRYWLKKFGLKTKTVKKTWSEKKLIEVLPRAETISDILVALGLQVRPGNYRTIQSYIKKMNLDISHLKGNKVSRGGKIGRRDEEAFKENSIEHTGCLKRRIIKNNLIPYICAICESPPIWRGEKLVLILDHINGINNDNRLKNLRFLCPNCNSQQPTFCRGNKRSKVCVIGRLVEAPAFQAG